MSKRLHEWPVHEVLISERWGDFGEITQVLVSRRSPETGDLALGCFLVDLGCLGIKNGFLALLADTEYAEVTELYSRHQSLVSCDLDLAAKVVLTGLEYADSLGFAPHRDAVDAFVILQGADASACDEPVSVGDGNGKPFYMSGPHDNVHAIMATLERSCGPGGYEYMVGGPSTLDLDLDESLNDDDLEG